MLCDRIAASCKTLGIDVTIVDGDLLDHPEFHQDYDAFGAPHYDANVYSNVGGAFWGRAAASPTALRDDVLGSIFWRRFRAIPGAPASHFERMNVNVTDYYAFRLTTDKTPGFLVEHGVGAPGAPDFQWLRDNVQQIADCWALSFAESGGVVTTTSTKGGDMTKDEVVALLTDYGIDKYKVPALVKEVEELYHHRHANPPDLVSEPLVPPVPGAIYFGADATLTVIGWTYPDGTVHYWKNGIEQPK